MTRSEFIKKNKHLFWYIKPEKIPDIGNDALVEFVFNYDSWEDVKELVSIIGYPELKRIFDNVTGRRVGNYIPEMYDLFQRIIKKHAS